MKPTRTISEFEIIANLLIAGTIIYSIIQIYRQTSPAYGAANNTAPNRKANK